MTLVIHDLPYVQPSRASPARARSRPAGQSSSTPTAPTADTAAPPPPNATSPATNAASTSPTAGSTPHERRHRQPPPRGPGPRNRRDPDVGRQAGRPARHGHSAALLTADATKATHSKPGWVASQ